MNTNMAEKPHNEHIEIARADSDPGKSHNEHDRHGVQGVYGTEGQQYDPKWERATVRRIDARLLIIRMPLPMPTPFFALSA
jgi:hypothetical protein